MLLLLVYIGGTELLNGWLYKMVTTVIINYVDLPPGSCNETTLSTPENLLF